ncbi:hypothetical protein MKX01_031621 [Papaver californicum]|nr:hypothetical protein MKX01_031621 [Papaver californicum]
MVAVTSTTSSSSSLLQSKLHHQSVNSSIQANLNYYSTTKSKPTLLHFHLIYKNHSGPSGCRVKNSNTNGVLSVKSYMENPNTISGIAGRILGSLPIIGLAARILIDEGGVGGDIIDFAEFRRRVGKKCNIMDSRAFYEFQDRRGKVGDPIYVLHCCWLAAVGAGLLKSEEILEGVARLSLSDDIEFEEETFVAIMNEAREVNSRAVDCCIINKRGVEEFRGIWLLPEIKKSKSQKSDVVEEEDEENVTKRLKKLLPKE